MDDIRGKTIAITGAARGIGYATAKALLARGARVVIGDRDVAVLESAVTGLSSSGQVSGYPLDVTDKESFATFLDKARTDGSGHVDVLINNAGVMPVGAFLEQSEQAIRSAIEVNFYGVLTGCRLVFAAEPSMRTCPQCSQPLQGFQYRLYDLPLEFCTQGHGYWLDAGEDERVLALMREEESHLKRSVRAEDSWGRHLKHMRSGDFFEKLRNLLR